MCNWFILPKRISSPNLIGTVWKARNRNSSEVSYTKQGGASVGGVAPIG